MPSSAVIRKYTQVQKDAAQELFNILDAEESLYAFFKQAWSSMEGGTPFVDGWHIGAIAEHLEAVTKR